MGKCTDRDHGFTMVFSLLYHLSLSHKHRLKTLQIGLNLSSYLRLKEGKKVVAIEVNTGEKKNPKDVECYSPALFVLGWNKLHNFLQEFFELFIGEDATW